MKEKLNPNKVGLVLGVFVALIHLVWALMVAGKMAQQWLDWVMNMHFINNPITVGQFDLGTSVMLLVMTFVIGYLGGWLYALVHNWLHKGKK